MVSVCVEGGGYTRNKVVYRDLVLHLMDSKKGAKQATKKEAANETSLNVVLTNEKPIIIWSLKKKKNIKTKGRSKGRQNTLKKCLKMHRTLKTIK